MVNVGGVFGSGIGIGDRIGLKCGNSRDEAKPRPREKKEKRGEEAKEREKRETSTEQLRAPPLIIN
jgi:hypothetical protein